MFVEGGPHDVVHADRLLAANKSLGFFASSKNRSSFTGIASPEIVGWIAVTVATGSEAEILIRELDPDRGRLLAEELSAWAGDRSKKAAAETLQRLGIAAAPVHGAADLAELSAADYGWAIVRGPDGALVKGFPFQFRRTPLAVRSRAPDLGEHTEAVLSDLLGLDRQELGELKETGVTRNIPAGSAASTRKSTRVRQ